MDALVTVERKGYGYPATLLINCHGEGCSIITRATNEMNSRGVLQNGFFLHVQERQLKV